jgi:predicted dehydrogenase
MTKRFNVAIVGAGIGERQSEGFLRNADKFRIAAVVDRIPEKAARIADAALAATGEKPRYVAEYDAFLQDAADIDIVSICLPPFLHFSSVASALKAGKHAICEKPLVGSLAETDALAALAVETKRTLMPIFQYRFGNGIAKAKHLIDSGAAGKIYTASIETHWTRMPPYYAVPWRGKMRTELGGVFLGHAIHIHDMLTHLVGEVRRVSAMTAVRVNAIETEDCAGALFEMADGSIAVSSGTLGSADEISRLRLICENVTMTSSLSPYTPNRDPWTFTPKAPRDGTFLEAQLAGAPKHGEGYTEQFARYHAALCADAELPITMADARRSIEIASAIYYSAQTGQRVELPLANHHPVYKGWWHDPA